MRAGAYTIHQSLTAEAAAVLKLALALARRRGHAQVTPLHVAFALLTGPSAAACAQPPLAAAFSPSSSPAAPYGLLKRACLRSHPAPGAAAQHPLQCRALELCFNVALNRLPTSGPHSPPSSAAHFASSLIQPSPTLSNALVAALKRAQANQRRGCETALMPPPSSSSSSPPPPPPPPIPPHFFLDPTGIAAGGGKGGGRFALWPAQFLAAPGPDACSDDVRAVLEVMVRKEGRRGNPVVVGDSVSMAEAVAGELLRRLERGDVPAELAGAHLLKLQLSYVHVRLMSRADVDARAAELRRSVEAVQLQRGGGLVVYVGDLRWALDEEPSEHHHATASSYSPVEHMVAELGRLLDDLRATRGRAWLVATASYQTYMRWQQRRRRPLESAWALQAVVVPTGSGTGLALNSLHSSSSSSSLPSASASPAMATAQQLGMAAGEPTAFPAARDEQDEAQLLLCTECSRNYEREASLVKAEAGAEGPRGSLPAWLVPDRPPADQTPHQREKYLIELKRKWSRLCRKLHLCAADPCPWWSGSCLLPGSQSKPSVAGFLGLEDLMEHGKSRTTSQWSPSPLPRWGPSPLMAPGCQGVGTALALGSHPLSDSATSDGRGDGSAAARELERRLRRNIPWQPGAVVAEIAEAAVAGRGGSDGGKGAWLYVKGSDRAAARRAATVIAETRCGSADRVVWADKSRFSCAEELCSDVVSRASEIGGEAFVVVVDDVENAPCDVADCLVAASKSGRVKDHRSGRELDLSGSVVILTTAKLTGGGGGGDGDVISLRLWSEDEAPSGGALKRKTESPQGECKRPRHDALDLNLNLCAEEDTDDEDDDGSDGAVPSDITHEGDSGDSSEHGHPHGLLESIAARVVTLDEEDGGAAATIRARLAGALAGQGRAHVDEAAVRALAAASGHFLEEVLERWAAEVLGPAAATVGNGGKGKAAVVLGLGPGGGAREAAGFMGSVLPSRVHVD
ncbi:uncharacterized protein C2845_PM15G02930 [Panicum miliaceum]|uniref:Clp R domain-containing protein n=1 Tax=Panicum miliaceum TaxID=4540 RepID=A0A3L6Q5V5_PANMI|nr:uncharacterized protein C2845_PM15G02930 [Panicum miliaceum]